MMQMKTKTSNAKGKAEPLRNTIIKTISLPKDLLKIGEQRALATRRTFSNHVSVCIEQEAAAAK